MSDIMADLSAIHSIAKLPHGFQVTFQYFPWGQVECVWSPDVPPYEVRSNRKFKAAYQAARAEFMTTLATMLGDNLPMVVIDTDDAGTPNEATAYRPQTKQ